MDPFTNDLAGRIFRIRNPFALRTCPAVGLKLSWPSATTGGMLPPATFRFPLPKLSGRLATKTTFPLRGSGAKG